MKRRVTKRRRARALAQARKLILRGKGRHDRWDILVAHFNDPDGLADYLERCVAWMTEMGERTT